jgi:hypothetical protein
MYVYFFIYVYIYVYDEIIMMHLFSENLTWSKGLMSIEIRGVNNGHAGQGYGGGNVEGKGEKLISILARKIYEKDRLIADFLGGDYMPGKEVESHLSTSGKVYIYL